MSTWQTMMSSIKDANVKTWFDLGLYLDRLKEHPPLTKTKHPKSFANFTSQISKGIAFITFHYSVDGVTMEMTKYAKALQQLYPKTNLHFIGGEFQNKANGILPKNIKKFTLKSLRPFDEWPLFEYFFRTKLQRGSKEYNYLIENLWKETIEITEALGKYIEKNNIKLLYTVNTNSNPGQVSLALALILISLYIDIPVISNNHDFYWEGGANEINRKKNKEAKGPRDLFFTNSHLGEVFSVLECCFPWEGRNWFSLNINKEQSTQLKHTYGHNPANVSEIGTAIDIEKFTEYSRSREREALKQIDEIVTSHKKENITIKKALSTFKNIDQVFPVIVGKQEQKEKVFDQNNLILLQPTRIIERKRIAVNFQMMQQLFLSDSFKDYFTQNDKQKITLVISGPIANGHFPYFIKILKAFEKFLDKLDPIFQQKVFLAFLFSEFDQSRFIEKHQNPITIIDLYHASSLVCLPSETEGRGLPIIEAAACGIPIVSRRYYPENVFAEVIGEHLPEEKRIKTFTFKNNEFNEYLINEISDVLLFPQNYINTAQNNITSVTNRYSLKKLQNDFEKLLLRIHQQLSPNTSNKKSALQAINVYEKLLNANAKNLSKLMDTNNRQYLAGYGQTAFMIYLKSLIDPSFFRVEEQHIKGYCFEFAAHLVNNHVDPHPIEDSKLIHFYNCINELFLLQQGSLPLKIDHSLAYRHRNTINYPYRKYTHQELTGIINILFNKIINPPPAVYFGKERHHNVDWDILISRICESTQFELDDRQVLMEALLSDKPIAFFPGVAIQLELEAIVLTSIRRRLSLKNNEEIQEKHLKKLKKLSQIYIFKQSLPRGDSITADGLKNYISHCNDKELQLIFKSGACKIIATDQICAGIHFQQLGRLATQQLAKIIKESGWLITIGEKAAMMTDIINLKRIHLGKATHPISANILGISQNSGFIQWVPAGVRATLAYPTPTQTGKSLSELLNATEFKKICDKKGKKNILKFIQEKSAAGGTPIEEIINEINQSKSKKEPIVSYKTISGLYQDGLPWAGVLATVNNKQKNQLKYQSISIPNGTKTVVSFIDEFQKKSKTKVKIGWNGGYILNPELVGKLGLQESYIGSPLGLIISDGKTKCPPLFNKPAFLVKKDNSLEIKRVNCSQGFQISLENKIFDFDKKHYNKFNQNTELAYIDLLFHQQSISIDNHYAIRLSGCTITEMFSPNKRPLELKPVGLTLLIEKKRFSSDWQVGKTLSMTLNGFEDIAHAVEAGPLLLEKGKLAIDMKVEGWTTQNSIRTQAARLDYLDMRGPKIAIGLDKHNQLSVLTINGRIRESCGATHIDMAEILLKNQMVFAMGFDPGGSSTLVADGKTLNISPYNKDYEENIYALPPQPRGVANCIVGFQEN